MRVKVKTGLNPSNYYWWYQWGTFVAVSFVLYSVLLNFLMFLFLHFCVFNIFNTVKVTELPPVWERAAYSTYHL